jgi:hypothetical protein
VRLRTTPRAQGDGARDLPQGEEFGACLAKAALQGSGDLHATRQSASETTVCAYQSIPTELQACTVLARQDAG